MKDKANLEGELGWYRAPGSWKGGERIHKRLHHQRPGVMLRFSNRIAGGVRVSGFRSIAEFKEQCVKKWEG